MRTLNAILLMTLWVCWFDIWCNGNSSYEHIKSLQESRLSPSVYSTTLRPVKDQTQVMLVSVSFCPVAIVSLDDVKQKLITNGFLLLAWKDERSSWNPSDYGGIENFIPNTNQIWRPRLLLINALKKRDMFRDEQSHTVVNFDGFVFWSPGGLFHTHCLPHLEKFPFDQQVCRIKLCPASHTAHSLQFVEELEMNMDLFYPNPGWELAATKTIVEITNVGGESLSCPVMEFKLKRRPTSVVVNVIIPVILLSFLNNMVFFIPVESGEKISYAITVLLALSVFLGMVSKLTPQVTNSVPALTIYLIILHVISTLTVVAAILTVYFHHQVEKEFYQRSKESYHFTFNKMMRVWPAPSDVSHFHPAPVETMSRYHQGSHTETETNQAPVSSKHGMVSRHIDKICFVIIMTSWSCATAWYLIYATS